MDRDKVIIKVSIQGIVFNVILVIFKAIVGLMANSIAIILDAVNNLSDALAQIITIIGTKLSAKEPDKEHPYGYGRIEYISSAIVAVLVLFAGVTALKESAVKTIHPAVAEYSTAALIIIAVAVVAKFLFGRYVKAQGIKVDSQALIATGTDSFMDSILSFSTLVAALISKFAGLSLEGILGVILSLFIIKAGVDILKETLGSIIGDRADGELTVAIKKRIREIDGVNGAYDVILHDYGPSRSIGSVHIEVDAAMTADEIHLLTDRIMRDMYDEFGILFTVGIYASNNDETTKEMRKNIWANLSDFEHVIGSHAFFVDFDRKYISYDLVVSHKAPSFHAIAEAMKAKTEELYPEYTAVVNIDHDYSD